jgi:hypothetical protein
VNAARRIVDPLATAREFTALPLVATRGLVTPTVAGLAMGMMIHHGLGPRSSSA